MIFTDAAILISDTIGGLQRRTDVLEKLCIDYDFKIEYNKSNGFKKELKEGN